MLSRLFNNVKSTFLLIEYTYMSGYYAQLWASCVCPINQKESSHYPSVCPTMSLMSPAIRQCGVNTFLDIPGLTFDSDICSALTISTASFYKVTV